MYPDRYTPLREDDLGGGHVFPSNALYSHIKLLGWQICKATPKQFFVAIPSDIFGDPKDSHFIAQIMKKIHLAKKNNDPKVTFWGTGSAIRHPLFEEDFETIIRQLMEHYDSKEPINIAPPLHDVRSVSSIVNEIRDVIDYNGAIEWDGKFSDGQKIKALDSSKLMKLGFAKFTPWRTAIEKMYQRFLDENKNNI
jgi:GDP-L-fucose synthase